MASIAHQAAPRLLGCTLRHQTPEGAVAVLITEVEAYEGTNDPASHAGRNRTPRNAIMFGPAGRLYVYRAYGMHWALNVVTGPEGDASAVLIRSGRVVDGIELARERRGRPMHDAHLARGPGCLAKALGATGEDNDAHLLAGAAWSLSGASSGAEVSAGPRVGVSLAHDVPWRFWLPPEPSVSAYRRSPRAPT